MVSQVTHQIPGQPDLLAEMVATFPVPAEGGRVLDIGTGAGWAARAFRDAGWQVVATGFNVDLYGGNAQTLGAEIELHENVNVCDMSIFPDAHFDLIWCAHVLEHVMDTGRALTEIRRVLKPGGKLMISVPPFKHAVVGGHVHAGWNLGYLIYVLAVAGFDLSAGRFVRHGYNIFGIADRGDGPLAGLHFANGDLEKLSKAGRLPANLEMSQNFSGNIEQVGWKWTVPPKDLPRPRRTLANPSPNPRLRIGFFVPWITKSRGGTENVGQEMANAMAARGHEVVIFTFDNQHGPSYWPLSSEIRLVHLSEEENEPADQQMTLEVATHGLDLLVGLHMNRTFMRYVRCARRLGLPIVLSEHGDPRMPNWIGRFSEDERAKTFYGATLIHVLTEAFRATLGPLIIDRVRVIPNTVPPADHSANPGKTEGTKIIVSVCRLVARKNVNILIDAFSRLASEFPDWNLRIIGDGPEKAALIALAKKKRVSERIEFAGESSEPYPFYESAQLFVTPSTLEGFSLVTCEAMAHGLPIVGYQNCNGVNQQVVSGLNGMLAAGWQSPESLAEAMRPLLADAGLRQQMGDAALQRYEQKYRANLIHDAWEDMFVEAIEIGADKSIPTQKERLSVALDEMVWGPRPLTAKTIF